MNLVYLNVGSNIARTKHICAGLDALQQRFGALEVSSVYESEALGFRGDPFYNLAVALYTDIPVTELATWLRQLEYSKGRVPGALRISPRTLDIDILCYADEVGNFAGVQLPRPEILENAHVLGPLAELAPSVLHPLTGVSYARLWADYGQRQNVWRVNFSWQGREISGLD